jgi:tyrosinase
MSKFDGVTRRKFIQATAVAAGAAAFPFDGLFAQGAAKAKYTRYNVMSPNGQKALASYAKGVEAMLNLKPSDPRNWFRNAFTHLMDCPHGNWWFYVWHRGYVGYFEQTIRELSGDSSFAMPYWDWTTEPRIPEPMFDGVLDPTGHHFEPYTKNLHVFREFIRPSLEAYWKTLTLHQRAQLHTRGYNTFDDMWKDVDGAGDAGNIAFAPTCSARYLTRDNPDLDKRTAFDSSAFVVFLGLLPVDFYNTEAAFSFTSTKTDSHMVAPGKNTHFSTLEGFPHNKVHNYIGGVGPLGPGPYGNMTNFLSPVDPIFFLHHSNMDRLWDVWTRKQKAFGLPYLPPADELKTLSEEWFLFYVNAEGKHVGGKRAGEFLSTERFDYDYESGFGEDVMKTAHPAMLKKAVPLSVHGQMKGHTGLLAIPHAALNHHLASTTPTLVAEVTVQRPSGSSAREFDILVGAPANVTAVTPDSPYYAGTIAFFGSMHHMKGMAEEATFAVPLPKKSEAFHNLAAADVSTSIRVVPVQQDQPAATLKAVSVRAVQ